MNINNLVYRFLISAGFKLIEAENSKYFGDYYDTFANSVIAIRFSSSKSIMCVDVCNLNNEEWFDLSLVKALIHEEGNLIEVTTDKEYVQFLQQYLTQICNLFHDSNYRSTKKNLKSLEEKRVLQMFPRIKH
jgi:hypothetical protein